MDLKTFLLAYRNGAKLATGRLLSRKKVVENIFKKNGTTPEFLQKTLNKYEKWEAGTGKPKEDADRLSIKEYFGINNFDEISEDVLTSAIGNYSKKFTAIQNNTDNLAVKKPEENGENSGSGEKPHTIPSGEQGKKSPNNTTSMEIEQRSMIKDLVRQNLLLTEAHKDLTEAHKELVKLLSNSEGNGSKEQAA